MIIDLFYKRITAQTEPDDDPYAGAEVYEPLYEQNVRAKPRTYLNVGHDEQAVLWVYDARSGKMSYKEVASGAYHGKWPDYLDVDRYHMYAGRYDPEKNVVSATSPGFHDPLSRKREEFQKRKVEKLLSEKFPMAPIYWY